MSIKLKRSDEEMRWKTISSEYVVKEPWMTVRKDKLMLPDGRIKDDYWSLEYPDWINVIAITKEGKYLFERQYRHGLGVVEWEIPAGVIEKGEEPMAAAKRELMEETGITGKDIRLHRLMDIRYYHQGFDLEMYVGILREDKPLREELNPLLWLPLTEDFADRERFAGEQNIAHIMNIAMAYPLP